jgi:hypothetical protein
VRESTLTTVLGAVTVKYRVSAGMLFFLASVR